MNDNLISTAFLDVFEGELPATTGRDVIAPLRDAYLEAGLTLVAADEAALADFLCGFAAA